MSAERAYRERVDMALAEAGFPNSRFGDRSHIGVPTVTIWRACSLSGPPSGRQCCFECYRPFVHDRTGLIAAQARCLADRPLVEDCGVAR